MKVWARPAYINGVVYAKISNGSSHGADIVSASSPVAESVELDQTRTIRHISSSGSSSASAHGKNVSVGSFSSTSSMSGMSMSSSRSSVTQMLPVRKIHIAPHSSITLAPGGYHVMLLRLHRALRPHDQFPVTLMLADGSHKTVTATVR